MEKMRKEMGEETVNYVGEAEAFMNEERAKTHPDYVELMGNENNKVVLAGVLHDNFYYSHTVLGEGFYTSTIEVMRKSGEYDDIPVLVSERLLTSEMDQAGAFLRIEGEYRSINWPSEGKRKLVLTVFAKEIEVVSEEENMLYINQILLDGFICKPTIHRMTPLGREITDVLLAVNRNYGKSSYIPCICWGRNARYAGSLHVGSHIRLCGRIQSRQYVKKQLEMEEVKTAYEVSVFSIEDVEHTMMEAM